MSILQVAPSREVLIGVSNVNPLREGMLDTFLTGVKQAGVTNYLIVALDQETAADLTGRGLNAFHMPIQVRDCIWKTAGVVCVGLPGAIACFYLCSNDVRSVGAVACPHGSMGISPGNQGSTSNHIVCSRHILLFM